MTLAAAGNHRDGRALTRSRLLGTCAALAATLLAALLLGMSWGAGDASLNSLLPAEGIQAAVERSILLEVRAPRVLLAALLGGMLSLAGVAFQALLRNPLADPYVLGVSGGASIGGVVAVLLGLGGAGGLAGPLGVPALAFAGALAAILLIERMATVGGRLGVFNVLLTGAVFNAFSAALIYFLQSIASLFELHAIVFYLMGQIPSYAPVHLALLAAAALAVGGALVAMARDYNALALGEEGAQQIGVNVERVKRRTLILGSLLTGLAVAVSGMIGFVGLVVPHLLRFLLGPDHRLLLPAAFFGGATFLVLSDLVARVAAFPRELPVGVVTALVGGPFFLYLLRSRRGVDGIP